MFAIIKLTFTNMHTSLFNDVKGEGFWAGLTRFGKWLVAAVLTTLAWTGAMVLATAIELGGLPLIAFLVAFGSTLAVYAFIISFTETLFETYNEDGTIAA